MKKTRHRGLMALFAAAFSLLPMAGAAQTHAPAAGLPVVSIPAAEEGTENVPLSTLEIGKAACGWGTIKADKSIEGNPITLRDTVYASGVGTHAPGKIIVKLNGSVTRFCARVGIDDEVRSEATDDRTQGTCLYRVSLRGQNGETRVVAEGTITVFDAAVPKLDVDVNGWKYLILENENGTGGNGCDHVDWANAYLVFQDQNSTRPAIVSEETLEGGLACAATVYSQPGVRFMHKVRTVDPAAKVAVEGLPAGLSWNAARQTVEGTPAQAGVYRYTIKVEEDGKVTDNEVTFTVSDKLPQPTPFMGWQSWNAVQSDISEDIVRQVADFFLESGLYEAGWNTIGLDDWWHADKRASDGKPVPNATRFPHGLQTVGDYLHDKGMQFSLYTNVAEKTCASAFGTYGHEKTDAEAYAAWGVDLVKTDYCYAPDDMETCRARYTKWGEALRASGRDIRLYVCEWGVREPWKWGAEAGGVCWRVSQDVRDCWIGAGSGVGVTQSINVMKNLSAWQGVNRFNDADMLCLGLHGTGKSSNDLCLTGPGMTQDEYGTQFALWCMWSSPMLLTFDPRTFPDNANYEDDMRMLLNRELIALNQDPMGQQADLVSEDGTFVIFAKDLENGDVALSATNLGSVSRTATFNFADVPTLEKGKAYTCRDIWAQKTLSDVKDRFTAYVRPHATRVFRLSGKDAAQVSRAVSPGGKLKVSVRHGQLRVTGCGAKGREKRVLVSDTSGRVVAQATSESDEVTLRCPAAPGVYVVSAVCDAEARAEKISVK